MKKVKKKTKKGQKKRSKGNPQGRTTAKGTQPVAKKEFRLPGLDPLADQLEKAGIDIPGLGLDDR